MQKDFSNELTPEVREKMKRNLVYVGIFSIIMIFAGLTSGYIVSMGDTFWVKYPLPVGFWISTAVIFLSSIFYQIALVKMRKEQQKPLRIFMVLTLIFGILFAVFQFRGYAQLVESGAHFSGPVIVTEGKYGEHVEIKYKGDFLEVNGNDFYLKGKLLNEKQWKEIHAFSKQFENIADPKGYTIKSNFPAAFVLYYQNEPLTVQDGKLMRPSGEILEYTDMRRLQFWSWNLRDKRGDFFHKGKFGTDFKIYYKGKELTYKNRSLFYNNQILSAPLQIKANQSRDVATSYLYILTFLHLLHIAGALIYLIRMVKISFSETLTFNNTLSLKLGAIFWHFLGVLWLYLLVFLLFIH